MCVRACIHDYWILIPLHENSFMSMSVCVCFKLMHESKTVVCCTMHPSACWQSLFSQKTPFPHFCNVLNKEMFFPACVCVCVHACVQVPPNHYCLLSSTLQSWDQTTLTPSWWTSSLWMKVVSLRTSRESCGDSMHLSFSVKLHTHTHTHTHKHTLC